MIYLISGQTGAGKSTYSRKLAKQKDAIYFALDDWMKTLFLPDQQGDIELNWMLERIGRCEVIMWSLCLQLLESGKDVIFDVGLSKFSHRQKFKQLAAQHNIDCQLHYVTAEKQTRLQRVISRNSLQSETYSFEVTPEMFEFMETWVEELNEEERSVATIIVT